MRNTVEKIDSRDSDLQTESEEEDGEDVDDTLAVFPDQILGLEVFFIKSIFSPKKAYFWTKRSIIQAISVPLRLK